MPKVIYNSYELPFIFDKFFFSENEKTFIFKCKFLITATTEGALITACQDAEKKLTEKNKNFKLDFGVIPGVTEFNLSHSANTGFLARPTLQKITDQASTAHSRAYLFSVEIQIPFDQAGYDYRRAGSFNVTYDTSRRRTIVFNMVYTSGGADEALTKYDAATGGKIWAESVITSLGGTFELVSENLQEEQERKLLTATIVYKEILANQSEANLNEGVIIDPSVSFSAAPLQKIGRSSGWNAEPSTIVSLQYSTSIDKVQVTGGELGLRNVYHFTVKPWLIKHAYDVLGLKHYDYVSSASRNRVVLSEQFSIDTYNFTIAGNITFIAPSSLYTTLECKETIRKYKNENRIFEKLMDGQDHTYNTYTWGKSAILTRIILVKKLGIAPYEPNDFVLDTLMGIQIQDDEAGGEWHRINRIETRSLEEVGVNTETTHETNEAKFYTALFVDTYRLVKDAGSGGVGAIGSGGTGGTDENSEREGEL